MSDVILIIEDVATITLLIKASLASKDVVIESAVDGPTGLQRVRDLKPALVLLDLALPHMHGFEVLQAIKASPDTASIPVVVVTAQSDSETALEAKRLGADRFIAKPFRPEEMRRVIDFFVDPVPQAN